MILAAGFGTRLRPITLTLPKPIVPVCNRPMIAYAVEHLLRAGIDQIAVNLHHLPEAIERFLRDEYGVRCSFVFSHEEQILGTGGAIRRLRSRLENEEDFFLVNGDTIHFPRFAELRAARQSIDAVASLTLRHPPKNDQFTPVFFDGARVTGFGKGSGETLMFSGSHAVSSRIFRYLPEREFSGIVEDCYQPLLDQKRESIAGMVDDGMWFDIGTSQRYHAASAALLEAMTRGAIEVPAGSRFAGSSLVHETASATGEVTRSTVGARSVVEGTLDRSFVWNDCRVARGARLTSCVVAHSVEIPARFELSNAMICNDDPAIPRDETYRFDRGLVIAPIWM